MTREYIIRKYKSFLDDKDYSFNKFVGIDINHININEKKEMAFGIFL
jgi:hypothetical protein